MRTQQNENKIYWPGNVFLGTEWFLVEGQEG